MTAYDPTAGNRTAAEEHASLLQDMLRGEAVSDATGFSTEDRDTLIDIEIAQGTDIMTYPLLGAADHAGFCEKKLRDMGLADDYKVEVATDRTIQLDFDIPFEQMLPQQFFDALEIFSRMLDVDQHGNPLPEGAAPKTANWRHLKSRNGRSHVIIDLSWDMPQAERIAWQAAMGSDFRREALSLAYAALGQMSPVLLYSRKEEVARYVPILHKLSPRRTSVPAQRS